MQKLVNKLHQETKILVDLEENEKAKSISIPYGDGDSTLVISDPEIIKKLVTQARVDYNKKLNAAVSDYKKQISQLKLD